ncbi:MAG: hypothetical protein HY899_15690 [Deltaproteobacteria bacterium]|nr:hypothetical protein [Deltaproteobacteria bacterium]
MKKVILSLSAIALVAAYASSASAQCAFNDLAKAKGIKSSMVRVFAGCPSTEHASINSSTGGGTPACAPVTVKKLEGDATPYILDAQKGSCDVQTKAKIEKDCALLEDANGDPLGLPAGPCHVTYVKSKCKGVMKSDGVTPIDAQNDAGWSLATLTRSSFNDATNGDVTVIDFPVTFAYGDPNNGQIKVDSNSAEALAAILVDPNGAALPTCSTLQTIKITVKDPDGLPFATMGGSTRDKEE